MPNSNNNVIEPADVTDVYVTGTTSIVPVGPCARVSFCVESEVPGSPELVERLVRSKLITPISAIPALIEELTRFLIRVSAAEAAKPVVLN